MLWITSSQVSFSESTTHQTAACRCPHYWTPTTICLEKKQIKWYWRWRNVVSVSRQLSSTSSPIWSVSSLKVKWAVITNLVGIVICTVVAAAIARSLLSTPFWYSSQIRKTLLFFLSLPLLHQHKAVPVAIFTCSHKLLDTSCSVQCSSNSSTWDNRWTLKMLNTFSSLLQALTRWTLQLLSILTSQQAPITFSVFNHLSLARRSNLLLITPAQCFKQQSLVSMVPSHLW